MPRKNPEHTARLEIRLPPAMLHAMKWTAEIDRRPLSDWVRGVLNERCFSVYGAGQGKTAQLRDDKRIVAERPGGGEATEWWRGERRGEKTDYRVYKGFDGIDHVGGLPGNDPDQGRQDFFMDRAAARQELRTWLNRWGRHGKTCRLTSAELNAARRLLASFDRDDPG